MELYLVLQGPNEACNDHMAVFKARVDAINAHTGLAGKHPGHMSDTFAQMAKEQGLSKEDLGDIDSKDRKKYRESL